MSDWSERDRFKAAATPRAWTTNPGKVTREDLFNAIDLLGRQIHQADHILNPAIRARLTEIRSLAATLIPKKSDYVCGHDYGSMKCRIHCHSEAALAEHRYRVHGVS